MRLTRRGFRLAAVVLLTAGACRIWAAPAPDPVAALKEINDWYSAQVKQAQEEKKTPDFRALMGERTTRAKAAIEGVELGSVEPTKCYALAQLYQAAGLTVEAGLAAERYVSVAAEPRMKYAAQQLMLNGRQAAKDAAAIVGLLGEMKPPDHRSAAYLAAQTASTYADTVAAKQGPKAALDLIAKVEGRTPFDAMTTQQEQAAAEMAIVQIALARADLLMGVGDQKAAVAALEAGKKRLAADSRSLRRLDAKLKQTALIGQPAPELKKDRQYGEFESLAALKGKVVVLDFGAHWCIFCKRGYPSLILMLTALKHQGLEVVGVTGYYGYYGAEKGLSQEQEYEKYADHIKEFSIPWPVVFGDAANRENYGVGGIPHYVLIDRAGIVRAISIGFSEELHAKFQAQVEKVLAEK